MIIQKTKNMKHLSYLIAILLLMATSCSNQDLEQEPASGKAQLQLRLSTEDSRIVLTRATAVPDVNDFIVVVKDTKTGKEEVKKTLKELKQETPLYLPAGKDGTEYTVEAYSNELKDAVLETPYFYASESVTLKQDEMAKVELKCSLQQFQVSFNPADNFKSSFRANDKLQDGDTKFKLTATDENGRSVDFTLDDLDKSAYFDASKASSYIKIHIEGTTLKGFPVDFTETIQPKDGKLERKDHLIIDLAVSETKSMSLKAITIEE